MATDFESMTGSEFLRLFGRNPNFVPKRQIRPQQSSGLPSLLELYNDPRYGELLGEIYPDRSEDARKQALGSFLLGSLAPAGLRIAQGVPIAEALEPTLTDLATAGNEAKRVRDVTEQARREARFKLASDELTRRSEALQKELDRRNKNIILPKDSTLIQDGEVIARGVQTPPKEFKVYLPNPNNPQGFDTRMIKQGSTLPQGAMLEKPAGTTSLVKRIDAVTKEIKEATPFFFAQQPSGKYIDLNPQEMVKVFTKEGLERQVPFVEYQTSLSTPNPLFTFDPTETVTIYPTEPLTIEGKTVGVNQPVTITKAIQNKLAPGSFNMQPMEMIRVFRNGVLTEIFRQDLQPTDTLERDQRTTYFVPDPNSASGFTERTMLQSNFIKSGFPEDGAVQNLPPEARVFNTYNDKQLNKLVNVSSYVANQQPNRYSIPDDSQKITVYDKANGNKVFLTFNEYKKNPDKYDVEYFSPLSLMDKNYNIKTAFSKTEEQKIRNEGFTFTPKIEPESTYTPITLSKPDNNADFKTASTLEQEINIRSEGYVVKTSATKKEKPFDLDESGARAALQPLSQKILDPEFDINSPDGRNIVNSFENYLGALVSRTGSEAVTINTGDGTSQTIPPAIPSFVKDALEKIVNQQGVVSAPSLSGRPEFERRDTFAINTFGLIDDGQIIEEPDYESVIRDANLYGNIFDVVGITGAAKSITNNVVGNFSAVFFGKVTEPFKSRNEVVRGLDGLNRSAELAWLRTISRPTQKQIDTFKQGFPNVTNMFSNPAVEGERSLAFAIQLKNEAKKIEGDAQALPSNDPKRIQLNNSANYLYFLANQYDEISKAMLTTVRGEDFTGSEKIYERVFK